VSENAPEFLSLEPLLQLQNEQRNLEPGQVIHVYPPFCSKEAADGVSLKPVSVSEALVYLSKLAFQISGTSDGEAFEFRIEP